VRKVALVPERQLRHWRPLVYDEHSLVVTQNALQSDGKGAGGRAAEPRADVQLCAARDAIIAKVDPGTPLFRRRKVSHDATKHCQLSAAIGDARNRQHGVRRASARAAPVSAERRVVPQPLHALLWRVELYA
jgi:hypothetical protein